MNVFQSLGHGHRLTDVMNELTHIKRIQVADDILQLVDAQDGTELHAILQAARIRLAMAERLLHEQAHERLRLMAAQQSLV